MAVDIEDIEGLPTKLLKAVFFRSRDEMEGRGLSLKEVFEDGD